MFSMFFGAGNVIFPLVLGQYTESANIWAISGLLITAVGVPFLGLIAMSLFNGDYKKFFGRLGPIPGFLITFVIMGLIGPFGALPRCIALSYATAERYFPTVDITEFSFFACTLIFILAVKKNRIVDVLGYVLTPILLGSLGVIIVKGFWLSPPAPESLLQPKESFLIGLKEGYMTMDLLGAFFFSSVVINCIRQDHGDEGGLSAKKVMNLMLKSSAIGASLLAMIYIGFSFVASFNAALLHHVGPDQLISEVALTVLGPYAGPVAAFAVSLACLTTAIALACVFAEFVHYDLSLGKVGYIPSLLITLFISYFISALNFIEIVRFLTPILQVVYPALIILTLMNLLYKLYNFKPVLLPFVIALLLSLADYFL